MSMMYVVDVTVGVVVVVVAEGVVIVVVAPDRVGAQDERKPEWLPGP